MVLPVGFEPTGTMYMLIMGGSAAIDAKGFVESRRRGSSHVRALDAVHLGLPFGEGLAEVVGTHTLFVHLDGRGLDAEGNPDTLSLRKSNVSARSSLPEASGCPSYSQK